MGILYIVATPIGNLQDISLRAIETLRKVDAIACEDTRRTGILLKFIKDKLRTDTCGCHSELISESKKMLKQVQHDNVDNGTMLISYYEQNEFKRIPEIINFLKNGKNIALVSDAGTPTISDPGFKLVRECIKEGIRVDSIPGPCSVILALTVSGLPTDKFLFLGYPPKKEGHRKKLFSDLNSSLKIIKSTAIFFEAPHRIVKTLEELQEVFGDIDIVLARELTKVHEEVRREKISNSLAHFQKTNPKGEFVILFNLGS